MAGPPVPPSVRIQHGLTLLRGAGARAGYLAAVDQGIISAANFLATVLLARAASPLEVGIYGVGFTSLRLVRALQEGLVIQPLNTFGAAMPEAEFRQYAGALSLLQILLAGGLALLTAASGWLLTRWGNDTAGPTLFALWFAFLTWQLQEHLRRLLYTRGAVFSAVINTLLANGVRLALMFILFRRGALDGIAGLDAIAWGCLAALLPGLWLSRRYLTWRLHDVWPAWQRSWEFGRWVLGGLLANWVAVEFYPILTAGMISFAAAGAYRILQNLVAPIHLLLRAVDTFLTPRAARQYQHGGGLAALRRSLRLTYLLVGLPAGAILLLAILFPGPLLHLVYGETYAAYAAGMGWMALFYGLMFVYSPLQTILKAMGRSRPIFSANALAIGAMFTLGLLAIRLWGVYGTIMGQVLNAAIVTGVLAVAWRRITQEPSASPADAASAAAGVPAPPAASETKTSD
jgi:O-antigen/teichoic acid export membrane protein